MARTITAANSTFVLAIPGVVSTPTALQDYGVDEAFDTEAADAAETQVGVDGEGVAGWVPREYDCTITFLATSASVDLFEQWLAVMDANQEVIYANGVIRLPSVQKQLTLARGVLRRISPQPNVRRVLANRQFTIRWLPQRGVPAIVVSPLG